MFSLLGLGTAMIIVNYVDLLPEGQTTSIYWEALEWCSRNYHCYPASLT